MIHVHGVQNFKIGRLRCQISNTNDVPLFFSLVDYRNNLFTSNDPKKIMEFYDGFENRDQLIQWMKERPKGVSYIHEVEGDKDVIVVIPTADFNGKYARECRDNIFKGLHMVFVESGIGNFYFNYAHNCNVGIKRAMEYNPKWVVVSNDDMVKEDPIERLCSTLSKLNNEEEIIIHTLKTGKYHSRDAIISIRSLRRKIVLNMMGNMERMRMNIESRLDIRYIVGSTHAFNRFIYKAILRVKYSGSFTIMSSTLINKMKNTPFDETFINGAEDIDLALLLKLVGTKVEYVNYKIEDIIGGTIGPYDIIRRTRDLANGCYLNAKIRNNYLQLVM